eukprot:gene20761-biopygen17603
MGFSHPPPRGRGLHLVAGRFAPGHYAFWLVVRSSSGVPPKIGSVGWGRGGVPSGDTLGGGGQGGSPAASSGSLKRPQRAAGVVSPQHFSRCREVPQMAPWTRA